MNNPPYYLTAYGLAKKHGFQGTEEEWVKSLQADQIQLRFHNNLLQWKYAQDADSAWKTLVNLSMLDGYVTTTNANAQKAELACQEISRLMELFDAELENLGQDVFEVTVFNTVEGYTANRSLSEIRKAYLKKQFCVCNYGGALLPLTMVDATSARFIAVIDGREYSVEIGDEGDVTVEVTKLAGSSSGGVFTVTYTDNEDEHQRIDKTFDEIRAAIDSGMDVRCEHRDGVNVARYSLSIYTNYLITFTAQQGNYACAISIRSDGSAEYSDVDLSAGEGGSGNYVLPVATADVLGGVMPAAKTEDMTQSVGVDTNGRLWTTPRAENPIPGEGGSNDDPCAVQYIYLHYYDEGGWLVGDGFNQALTAYFSEPKTMPVCVMQDYSQDTLTDILLPLVAVNHDDYSFTFRRTVHGKCYTAKLTIEDINDEWGTPVAEVTVEDAEVGGGGAATSPKWHHLDTLDLSSGAVSYEFDTTGCSEIMLLATTALNCSGGTFDWKQFPIFYLGAINVLPKSSGGATHLRYMGDGTVTIQKPRNDGDTLQMSGVVTGVADADNTLKISFTTVTSGVIGVYGR